jgi:hypothetical protein
MKIVETSKLLLRRTWPSTPLRAAVASAVVAGALAGGVAAASIPDGSGVINACATKAGRLSVIDTAINATCRATSTALAWPQTGPQGPQGSQGPQGAPGPQGPQGPDGNSAFTALQNVTGTAFSVSPGAFAGATVTCPVDGGQQMYAADGSEDNTTTGDIRLIDSYPGSGDDSWVVDVENTGSVTHVITPYATCVLSPS